MSLPRCSEDGCAEQALARIEGAGQSAARFLCMDHTVNAVRVASARKQLLDVLVHSDEAYEPPSSPQPEQEPPAGLEPTGYPPNPVLNGDTPKL